MDFAYKTIKPGDLCRRVSLRQNRQEEECWNLLGERIRAVLWPHDILPTAEVSKVFKATVPKSPHSFFLLYAYAVDWLICHTTLSLRKQSTSLHTQLTQMATCSRVARFSEQNPPNCYSKLAQSCLKGGPRKKRVSGENHRFGNTVTDPKLLMVVCDNI